MVVRFNLALLLIAVGAGQATSAPTVRPALILFVDLNLAEAYRRLGRDAEASAMLNRITRKAAADHNIIPEMYVAVPCPLFPGKIGDATGALPMVGYGAGAYVLHLLARERMAPGTPREVGKS